MEREAEEKRAQWAALGAKDKVAVWASNHQLSIIVGSWATALGIAGNIIWRDPYMSAPNKFVQARVVAQGLAIGALLATAALTHSQRAESASKMRTSDHTWAHVIEDQRRAKEQAQSEKTPTT